MIVYGHYEWDIREAARNFAKTGVSFKEATSIFEDQGCTISQRDGSCAEAVGVSQRGRSLLVVHQPGQRVRILSAQPYVPGAPKPVEPPAEIAAPAPPEPPVAAAAPAPEETAPKPAVRRRVRSVNGAAASKAPAEAPPASAPPPAAAAPEPAPAAADDDAGEPAPRDVRPPVTRKPTKPARPAAEPAPQSAAPPPPAKADKPAAKRASPKNSWRAAVRALGQAQDS